MQFKKSPVSRSTAWGYTYFYTIALLNINCTPLLFFVSHNSIIMVPVRSENISVQIAG